MNPLELVVLGLSLSSSWGNGHATTYRALLKALAARGHRVTFFERDQPWYAANRDLPKPDFCDLVIYDHLRQIERFHGLIAHADMAMVGSFVPDGVAIGRYVQRHARGIAAFYDIDTPVTLAALERGECDYLAPELIPDYDLYLSFTGGPTLDIVEQTYHSPATRPLYCSVDATLHAPIGETPRYDLGYLGTYSQDRQPALEHLLIDVAQRAPDLSFVVGGSQYPAGIDWPENVERVEHVPPSAHSTFFGACRFALNVTRADMLRAGYSPSVRLFEAAACGVPVISDPWQGLDQFFTPPNEIALAATARDVLAILRGTDETARRAMGRRARRRALAAHSAERRALELEGYIDAAKRAAQPSLGKVEA